MYGRDRGFCLTLQIYIYSGSRNSSRFLVATLSGSDISSPVVLQAPSVLVVWKRASVSSAWSADYFVSNNTATGTKCQCIDCVTNTEPCAGTLPHTESKGDMLLKPQEGDSTNCAWSIYPEEAVAIELHIIASHLKDTDLVCIRLWLHLC